MTSSWNRFVMVATITSKSIVVFAILAPPIEEGTREARATMAYRDVRTLPNKFVGEAPYGRNELSERNPWDNAYVIEALEDGVLRVTSAGPDGVFDSTASSSDDIWTDMPDSPLEPFQIQRNRELMRAIAIGLLTWIAFIVAYWWSERSLAKRRKSSAAPESPE